jgi:inner membrane protein
MDPLTHTLLGANLAATRLGQRTRLAAAALVVGANAPDVDGVTYWLGSDAALGFRRGWTHGVLALALLPLLQVALLLLYDRSRPDPARPANPRWLLVLSAVAIWSHPLLDWFNTYGVRWLMPFRPTWFYGDAVFIMDPWIWLALGAGWLAGRQPTWPAIGLWGLATLALVRVVARRAPEHLPVVAAVAIVLLATLLWRAPARTPRRVQALATAGLGLTALYVAGRIALSELTEREARRQLLARAVAVERVMAGPHPLDPLRWSVVAEGGGVYRYGHLDWRRPRLELATDAIPVPTATPLWQATRAHPSVRGFITWARFPAYEVDTAEDVLRVHLFDLRRGGRARSGFGTSVVELPLPLDDGPDG